MRPDEALGWARSQTPWTPESLKRISDLVLDNARVRDRMLALQKEADDLSVNLASTYEEISLLYRLTQNLKISKSDEDLGRVALEWMKEVVPAAGLAIQLLPVPDAEKPPIHAARSQAGAAEPRRVPDRRRAVLRADRPPRSDDAASSRSWSTGRSPSSPTGLARRFAR